MIISPEISLYLKDKKRKKLLILSTQILLLIGLIALWEFAANIGIIDSFITSQPSRILKTFLNFEENRLFYHIGITCFETIFGFIFFFS